MTNSSGPTANWLITGTIIGSDLNVSELKSLAETIFKNKFNEYRTSRGAISAHDVYNGDVVINGKYASPAEAFDWIINDMASWLKN